MENTATSSFTFSDLFCGIGGFHIAAAECGLRCVFSCDIDKEAQRAYRHNFGITPAGDITEISPESLPDHDILFAGFPCQPFSIIGAMRGFEDVRGTLFFNLAEIIAAKKPTAFLLENVRQLSTHNRGQTLERITRILTDLGYRTDWKLLNALDYGLPQKRERTFITGFLDHSIPFNWPTPFGQSFPLESLLESHVPQQYFASAAIREKRLEKHQSSLSLGIWHENKGGNVSSHPFSCALRAGASYNYLLVNGERRLTPREMLRLQGFPEWFDLPGTYQQIRKQTGNAVPVPVVKAVLENMIYGLSGASLARRMDKPDAISTGEYSGSYYSVDRKQYRLLERGRTDRFIRR
ncbi:MAG: DNA (cytosine-5-)-methyltransferase [Opitutae bacterium]|nr:DNA (cytosine-5-)-methyltransferase [Opitutae bacterium]